MSTQTIHWEDCFNPSVNKPKGHSSALALFMYPVIRAIVAFAAGVAMLAGSVWVVNEPGLIMYIQALTWSASFVFFAVAIESHKSSTSRLAAVTGIAIQLIAILSAYLGAEVTILSTLLMSVWLAMATYKR